MIGLRRLIKAKNLKIHYYFFPDTMGSAKNVPAVFCLAELFLFLFLCVEQVAPMLKQQLWTGENVMRLQRSWLPALSSAFPSRTTTNACALRWVLPSSLPWHAGSACECENGSTLRFPAWQVSAVDTTCTLPCLSQAAPVWRCVFLQLCQWNVLPPRS